MHSGRKQARVAARRVGACDISKTNTFKYVQSLGVHLKKKKRGELDHLLCKILGSGGSEVVGHRRSVGVPGPIRPARSTKEHTLVETERVGFKKKKKK